MNENLKVYPYIDPDAGIDDADRRKGREHNRRFYERNKEKIAIKNARYRAKRKGVKKPDES